MDAEQISSYLNFYLKTEQDKDFLFYLRHCSAVFNKQIIQDPLSRRWTDQWELSDGAATFLPPCFFILYYNKHYCVTVCVWKKMWCINTVYAQTCQQCKYTFCSLYVKDDEEKHRLSCLLHGSTWCAAVTVSIKHVFGDAPLFTLCLPVAPVRSHRGHKAHELNRGA